MTSMTLLIVAHDSLTLLHAKLSALQKGRSHLGMKPDSAAMVVAGKLSLRYSANYGTSGSSSSLQEWT